MNFKFYTLLGLVCLGKGLFAVETEAETRAPLTQKELDENRNRAQDNNQDQYDALSTFSQISPLEHAKQACENAIKKAPNLYKGSRWVATLFKAGHKECMINAQVFKNNAEDLINNHEPTIKILKEYEKCFIAAYSSNGNHETHRTKCTNGLHKKDKQLIEKIETNCNENCQYKILHSGENQIVSFEAPVEAPLVEHQDLTPEKKQEILDKRGRMFFNEKVKQ